MSQLTKRVTSVYARVRWVSRRFLHHTLCVQARQTINWFWLDCAAVITLTHALTHPSLGGAQQPTCKSNPALTLTYVPLFQPFNPPLTQIRLASLIAFRVTFRIQLLVHSLCKSCTIHTALVKHTGNWGHKA